MKDRIRTVVTIHASENVTLNSDGMSLPQVDINVYGSEIPSDLYRLLHEQFPGPDGEFIVRSLERAVNLVNLSRIVD